MVITTGSRRVATGALLAATILGGCAGGESDTVGAVSLTAALSAGEETGAADPEGSTSGSSEDLTSGPATTDPGVTGGGTDPDPSGTSTATPTSGPGSTGPGLACMFAEDCDDADPCTEDNCLNSACSNDPITCDDGIDCTMDACDPATGACANVPDDAACDDGDLCTGLETCSAAAGCMPGEAVTCSDGIACTMDTCDPMTGTCGFSDIDDCMPGDGCCPIGCSVADTDCSCDNLALDATPSSSGGGIGIYGADNWTNGAGHEACDADCLNGCFGWIDNDPTPGGAWMQLQWGTTQIIGSMFIDGYEQGDCDGFTAQRALAGGTVQYWNGASWVDAQTFSGGSGDLDFTFDPPLQTTRLRIFNAVAPVGGYNSLAYEWFVYEPLGCTP